MFGRRVYADVMGLEYRNHGFFRSGVINRFRCGLFPFIRLPLRGLGVSVLAFCWLACGLLPRSSNNVYAKKILVANRTGFEAGALIDEHMLNP